MSMQLGSRARGLASVIAGNTFVTDGVNVHRSGLVHSAFTRACRTNGARGDPLWLGSARVVTNCSRMI
jgi:hypothetical protein